MLARTRICRTTLLGLGSVSVGGVLWQRVPVRFVNLLAIDGPRRAGRTLFAALVVRPGRQYKAKL